MPFGHGTIQRRQKGQEQLKKFAEFLDKYYAGKLKMTDLQSFSIIRSIGAIVCTEVVKGQEAIAKLRSDNPDAS